MQRLVSISAFVAGVLAAYSPSDALMGWELVNAAYCPATQIKYWSCSNCLASNLKLSNVTVVQADSLLAFAGWDSVSQAIIMSYRGTDNIPNWINNIDAFLTTYPNCAGCQVHTGFYQAYLFLAKGMKQSYEALRSAHPNAPVRVFGHSLGGATAVHAVADLIHTYNVVPMDVYTYGQPRVGNPAFATWFTSVTKGRYFRVTHRADIVPHLPEESYGYRHSPTEYFYPANPPAYKVCDASGEDPTCMNSERFLNVADHMTYMGGDCCCDNTRLALPLPSASTKPSALPIPSVPLIDCSNKTTCGACINVTLVDVPACSWCIPQGQCHDVGSSFNPCPPDDCVSKSPISRCTNSRC